VKISSCLHHLSPPPLSLASPPCHHTQKHDKNDGVSGRYSTAPTREKMTPDHEQTSQLHEALRNMLGGREPRNFQVEMVQAQEEGCDALCHAATGSGKTAIAAGPYAVLGMQTTHSLHSATLPFPRMTRAKVPTFLFKRRHVGAMSFALSSQTQSHVRFNFLLTFFHCLMHSFRTRCTLM
jgi:hypothetical protein